MWGGGFLCAKRALSYACLDAAREFPEDSWEEHKALQVGNAIVDAFEYGNPKSILECRRIAREYLGDLCDSSKVYETDNPAIVHAIGHCHIGKGWSSQRGIMVLL
jgi:alpha-mannosidase